MQSFNQALLAAAGPKNQITLDEALVVFAEPRRPQNPPSDRGHRARPRVRRRPRRPFNLHP
jgi:hypothetical protein